MKNDPRLPVDPDASPVDLPPEPARRRLVPAELDLLGVIALGGALGAMARYAVSLVITVGADGFPWPTFWTNVSGCFVLALLLICVMELWPPHRYIRPFAAVGFVGAYTTFSTAMVEIDELLAHAHVGIAVAYLTASVGAGLAGIALGLVFGRALVTRRARHVAAAGSGGMAVTNYEPAEENQ
jgi:CrcB protein